VSGTRTEVQVLLLFGDQAELLIPERKFTPENPLRVPVSDITAATGLKRGDLPGRKFTAVVSESMEEGVVVAGYEVVRRS
jgi:hypothetical protein